MQRLGTLAALFCIGIVFWFPDVTFAQGVIPCGDEGNPCQACHLVQLGKNVMDKMIGILVGIMVLIFVYAGVKVIMAGGSTSGLSEGKKMMTNAVVGFVIILSSWLIIDTALKVFVSGDIDKSAQFLGRPWNKVECTQQTLYKPWIPGTSRPVVGGGTESTISGGQIGSRISASAPYRDRLCALAAENGIANQCDSLQALLAIESNGQPRVASPVGAAGLMQLMPATARVLDSSLTGKSDEQVREALKNPEFNMKLGVKYYAQLHRQFGGDETKIFAAYNGGPGANSASRDCPGQMRWQCEWDNAAHTVPNTGYRETRNYVANVSAIRDQLKK